MGRLEIKVALQVSRPADEVFEAIVDPEKMSNYFISESTERMEPGKTLIWRFPEFDFEFPVHIDKVEKDRYVSFKWEMDGEMLLVEFTLEQVGDDATVVTVTEKSMENNEAGLKWLMGNSAGWANCLACLKAYLEYGINLRKGGFDFMRKD
jgi:uncharacterized protein YndB with AHSA1/START domain